MTRDKAINILARLAGGATQPSWDDIRKAARFACDVLSASKEDEVHIQFNDDRTLPKQQPQGLDEAAEEYTKLHITIFPDGSTDRGNRQMAFKAGAKWMAEQGVIAEVTIDEFSPELYNKCVDAGLTSEDKVIVQIRRKE